MPDWRVPASPAGPGFGPNACSPTGDSVRTKNTLMPVVVRAEREQRARVGDGRARRDRGDRAGPRRSSVPSAMPPSREHRCAAGRGSRSGRTLAVLAAAASSLPPPNAAAHGWSSRVEEVEVQVEDHARSRASRTAVRCGIAVPAEPLGRSDATLHLVHARARSGCVGRRRHREHRLPSSGQVADRVRVVLVAATGRSAGVGRRTACRRARVAWRVERARRPSGAGSSTRERPATRSAPRRGRQRARSSDGPWIGIDHAASRATGRQPGEQRAVRLDARDPHAARAAAAVARVAAQVDAVAERAGAVAASASPAHAAPAGATGFCGGAARERDGRRRRRRCRRSGTTGRRAQSTSLVHASPGWPVAAWHRPSVSHA